MPALAVFSLGAVLTSLPPAPAVPAMPAIPKLTSFPDQPRLATIPELPSVPALPSIASVADLSALSAPFGEDGHFDRSLTVTGPVDLDVQTGSGNIVVKTGDASKVEVHATIRANHPSGDVTKYIQEIEANPPIDQNGNVIRIGHIENDNWKRNISISYELVVPAQTKLRSESGSGDEKIDGVSGPLDSSSGSGSLTISNIGNEVHAQTGSGSVELKNVHGNAKLTAGSGSISASGIAGGLIASSGSGSIHFEQTAAGSVEIHTGSGEIEVTGANGAVVAQTGSGGISVEGTPAGEWRLRSGSGDVNVKLPPQASFNLVAHTGSGSIDSNREIAVQGKISPRELQGKVGGGGPVVELSTSSGSIQIR